MDAAADAGNTGAGIPGDNFNKPTDIAWDSAGNTYVTDGYGNSRVVKIDANGKFVKSWGTRGSEPGQFNLPLSIAIDAQDNIYVADRGNKRIQVFDTDGAPKRQITGAGAPWAICISPGAHPYLYSSSSNDPNTLDDGAIYKMELDGTVSANSAAPATCRRSSARSTRSTAAIRTSCWSAKSSTGGCSG